MKKFQKIGLLFVSAILLFGCGQNKIEEKDIVAGIAPESVVEMSEGKFTPDKLTAKAGDDFMVKLKSVEGTHSFKIDELSVNSAMLSPDSSEILNIKIPADAKGKEYEYYCGVTGHKEAGMVGKLVVK